MKVQHSFTSFPNDWCQISNPAMPSRRHGEVHVMGALRSRRARWTRAHRALGAFPRAASGATHQLHTKLGELGVENGERVVDGSSDGSDSSCST